MTDTLDIDCCFVVTDSTSSGDGMYGMKMPGGGSMPGMPGGVSTILVVLGFKHL